MSTTVRQLLSGKGDQIFGVGPQDTVFEAIRRMAEHGVGALLVMAGAELHGILSERDYARKVILQGKNSRDTAVADIMTPKEKLIVATPAMTVNDCLGKKQMKRRRKFQGQLLLNQRRKRRRRKKKRKCSFSL